MVMFSESLNALSNVRNKEIRKKFKSKAELRQKSFYAVKEYNQPQSQIKHNIPL